MERPLASTSGELLFHSLRFQLIPPVGTKRKPARADSEEFVFDADDDALMGASISWEI